MASTSLVALHINVTLLPSNTVALLMTKLMTGGPTQIPVYLEN